MIQRVLLVGGTHGNELIGVYLIKKFEQAPQLVRRSSFETFTLLGNPRAVKAGTRYIDKDLNRSFKLREAESCLLSTTSPYEIQRAREIHHEFGQAGQMPIDLIIDLHSTTSNAGLMLILDSLDSFILNLSVHLTSIQPALHLYSSVNSGRSGDSLRSIAQYRIGIEVGPIAHGTLQAELFQKTEAMVHAILDYVEQYNCGLALPEEPALTLYQYVGMMDFPRNEKGEITAMVHSQLQFQDYMAIQPGDPLFLTFDGDEILYQGNSTVYPIFINETAYYEKGIAMCLTQKQQLHINKQA